MLIIKPCCFCTGLVDPSELLANIEAQIVRAKEEAISRKEIMDRIDRWLSACEEENWLEDYNQVCKDFSFSLPVFIC
jgi:hypothetical protein